MKKILLFAFGIMGFAMFSQPLADIAFVADGDVYSQLISVKSEKVRKKVLESTFVVCLTGIEEIDNTFHVWAEKYWKFKTPLFVTQAEFKKYEGDEYTRMSIDSYESKDGMIAEVYYTSKFIISTLNDYYSFEFDNFKSKNLDHFSGTDITAKNISEKLLVYLLLFDREITDNSRIYKAGGRVNAIKTASTSDLKTKTILIPDEYLMHGLTKEDFAVLKQPIEFMPSSKINEKIKSGENLQKYCQFIMTKIDKHSNRVILVDLSTFSLLGFSNTYEPDRNSSSEPINAVALKKLLAKIQY